MAVLGDTLFLGTGDAHLIALDMKTGTALWDGTFTLVFNAMLNGPGSPVTTTTQQE